MSNSIPDPTKLSIPLIDVSPLTSPTLSARQTCAESILSAFQTHGFLYITSPPGISATDLSNVFTHSAAFFARPQSQKNSLAWTTPLANRGYVAPGREKTSHALTAEEVALERAAGGADLKESMEIGRDGVPGAPNKWPDRLDEQGIAFRNTMTTFFEKCAALHQVLMSALALGMGLEESYFEPFLRHSDNNLRLLHYPPVERGVFRRNGGAQVRAGAHTDYGTITLLWQDGRGGLQVQPEGEGGAWKDVVPVPGSVVVNAGDLLARWMNEKVRSTRHRVVEPPHGEREDQDGDKELVPARYSIAYFCNPDYDSVIDALPNTYASASPSAEVGGGSSNTVQGLGEKKYPPVKTEDYLVGRLTATY